jgi:ABC-2 type transport system permease protein
MSGTWFIFRREVVQYFTSPLAYTVAFAILVITGFLFIGDLTTALTLRPANAAVVPAFLSFAMIVFAPILTMRLLAEETREGTLELLLTAPISDTQIVLGKFLGAWFYYSVVLLVTFSYQIILITITRPDMGHAISAYLGIWLYGGATLAVGMVFSALSENQIVAAFLTFATLLLLWFAEYAAQIVGTVELAQVIRQLTLGGHFNTSFGVGIIRLEDIVYYAGIIVVALFVAIRVVESQRWR